eukprot:6178895-Pleurochrysis_carterae.AAC.6
MRARNRTRQETRVQAQTRGNLTQGWKRKRGGKRARDRAHVRERESKGKHVKHVKHEPEHAPGASCCTVSTPHDGCSRAPVPCCANRRSSSSVA